MIYDPDGFARGHGENAENAQERHGLRMPDQGRITGVIIAIMRE
jgi:hypothetical protein